MLEDGGRKRRNPPVSADSLPPAEPSDELGLACLMELDNGRCRWPMWGHFEPAPGPWVKDFCGAKPVLETPYCLAHHRKLLGVHEAITPTGSGSTPAPKPR